MVARFPIADTCSRAFRVRSERVEEPNVELSFAGLLMSGIGVAVLVFAHPLVGDRGRSPLASPRFHQGIGAVIASVGVADVFWGLWGHAVVFVVFGAIYAHGARRMAAAHSPDEPSSSLLLIQIAGVLALLVGVLILGGAIQAD